MFVMLCCIMQETDTGWFGSVGEIEVYAKGNTLEEAKESLNLAVDTHIEYIIASKGCENLFRFATVGKTWVVINKDTGVTFDKASNRKYFLYKSKRFIRKALSVGTMALILWGALNYYFTSFLGSLDTIINSIR